MSKPVILTGIRANNDLHIGNYFGALLPIVDMARQKAGDFQINLFVPDLHSFTTPIDHSKLYSTGAGVYTNGAEEFFSRMRRAEIGHHHHIAGAYLVRYAQESAWREDHRRVANGQQVKAVAGLAMMAPTSVDWCGYWQRAQKAA